MSGPPIQHPGEQGRELPLVAFHGFSDLEKEHLFLSAGRIENFFNNFDRNESLNDAYHELMEVCTDKIQGPDKKRTNLIVRRIRSYILEVDIFLKHWEKYFGSLDKKRHGA